MKIKELYELYGITKDDFRFFYDTKIKKLVPIQRHLVELMENGLLLEEDEYEDSLKEQVKILHFYEKHPDELIYFPTVDMFDIINAKEVFIRELDEDMRPQFDYLTDSKEDLETFLTKVEDMHLIKRWDRNYTDQIEQRVNDWINANNIEGIYNPDYYNKPLRTLKKISKLNPWKYFKKKALIKIQVGQVSFYIKTLGDKNIYKGLVIYPGESGLNDLEMITNVSLDGGEPPLINMALQNSIMCSFSSYDELTSTEQNILNKSNIRFYKGKCPSIREFREGYYPTSEIDEQSMHLISSVLEIAYNGILECMNQKYLSKLKDDELLQINLDQNDKVSISSWVYVPSETINNYGLDIEPRKATCFLDDTLNYEVKVDVISSPIDDGFNKFYVFSLFVVDLDTGMVVFNGQSYYNGEETALKQLSKQLHDFAEDNDFATNVTVSDFVSEMLVVSSIGDDVEIEYEQPSPYMEEIFTQLNSLTEKFDQDDDDEVDYRTLN